MDNFPGLRAITEILFGGGRCPRGGTGKKFPFVYRGSMSMGREGGKYEVLRRVHNVIYEVIIVNQPHARAYLLICVGVVLLPLRVS